MVVITDGGDTVSKVDYPGALRAAQQAEAIVYSVIIVPIEASAGRDTGGEHALIQLSADTGGRYFYATSAAQLDEAFRQLSDETPHPVSFGLLSFRSLFRFRLPPHSSVAHRQPGLVERSTSATALATTPRNHQSSDLSGLATLPPIQPSSLPTAYTFPAEVLLVLE